MKYFMCMPLAIAILTTSAYAFQPSANVEIFEQFDDIRVVAFISENEINNSPLWDPDMGTPPLNVKEAIQALREFNNNSKKDEAIKEIEIKIVPRHLNHWHYLIKTVNNVSKNNKFNVYVVLMNGKVIPATIEPEAYK
ncbi:MAG: hypothetical protein BMS9Abin36_0989 [Gammaproteobacteria bacterium]|nr:MAG: hypothetical protein BMS9Abin36_0989 [Gammaproteobacteria bacterium]